MILVLHADFETGNLTDNIGQYLVENDGKFQGGSPNFFLYESDIWVVNNSGLTIKGRYESFYTFSEGFKVFESISKALLYGEHLINQIPSIEIWIIDKNVKSGQILINKSALKCNNL